MNFETYTALELQKMGVCIVVGNSEVSHKPLEILTKDEIPAIDQEIVEHYEAKGFTETGQTKFIDKYKQLHGGVK